MLLWYFNTQSLRARADGPFAEDCAIVPRRIFHEKQMLAIWCVQPPCLHSEISSCKNHHSLMCPSIEFLHNQTRYEATPKPASREQPPCSISCILYSSKYFPTGVQGQGAAPQAAPRPQQALFDITVMDPIKLGDGVGVRCNPHFYMSRILSMWSGE